MVDNINKLMSENHFHLLESLNNKLVFVKYKTKIEILLDNNKNRINYSSLEIDYSIFNIMDEDLEMKLSKILYPTKEEIEI